MSRTGLLPPAQPARREMSRAGAGKQSEEAAPHSRDGTSDGSQKEQLCNHCLGKQGKAKQTN